MKKLLLSLCLLPMMNSFADDNPQKNHTGSSTNFNCDSTCLVPQNTNFSHVNISITNKDVGKFNWGAKCGPASNSILPNAPNSFLCDNGNPSAVTTQTLNGETIYSWSCIANNGSKVLCSAEKREVGICGASHGQILSSNPSNLCSSGEATLFNMIGNNYQWYCKGNYGSAAACSATYYSPPPDPVNYGPACKYHLSNVPIAFAQGYSTPDAPCTIICYGTGPNAVCDVF